MSAATPSCLAPQINDPRPLALWLYGFGSNRHSAAAPGGRVFDRNDYTRPGRRPRSIHGTVTFPASTRRRSKTRRDPFAASSMTAQSRCSSTSLPPPLTPIPKSVPNGSYAEKLLGSFEHLRIRDALAFAQQSCRSGPRLVLAELKDAGMSARRIAAELTARSIATPNGGRWHAQTVLRMMYRGGS